MTDVIKQLLASKKFAALAIGLLSTVISLPLVKFMGLPLEEAKPMAEHAAQLVMAYMVAQGMADHGKEAKKV